MLQTQLQELGYELKMKVIRAVEYGVPQMRERVFIVALNKGIDFQFPDATHGDPLKPALSMCPLPPYITVGEVLKGLGPKLLRTRLNF
ncbi:DNA cytosine methyltransferase [Iningainema tapete]|uniref:DNA cytosine methyltransferase n=1 Tax=Iningainema tapete BLCC-T55 TaxID=2748662 RepID=A0A8J6XK61_9CYAN|nr:DNA cytosine methyltransferase [Iningainema tapete BLCC-T55]